MAVSTSTASRLPKISVEEIGDHLISLAPGGRSSVTTGIWALTKTSHCNRLVIIPPRFSGSVSVAQRCCSTRRFRQKGLHFLVEIPRYREGVGTPIRSQETGHPVIGNVDTVRAFADDAGDRLIRPDAGTEPCHFFHGERITLHQAHASSPISPLP